MNQYPINEIFYSLQGEGYWSGRPAVFIRMSGCNLACPFCDTDHRGFTKMTAAEILERISSYESDFVVLTGGEPSLYADAELIDTLHSKGKYVAIETNGTHPLTKGIDWVTLSPKDCFVDNADVVLARADEVKLIFDGHNAKAIERYANFPATHHYLQPCDTGHTETNNSIIQSTIQYCLHHPVWTLSLQQHKLLGIQ